MSVPGGNIFALLNEDGDLPQAGRKGDKKAKPAAAANKKPLPQHSFPGEQPAGANKHSARVPDRQKESHRGGRRGGASTRGRSDADPSVRQFDRRGAPTRHAPHRAQKDGALLGPQGGVEAVEGESVAEVVADEAAVAAEGGEEVLDLAIAEVDPEDDGTQTYEEYLAALEAKRVEEDLARQIREVQIDESQFQKVRPIKREEDEEDKDESEEARARRKEKKQRSKQVISLDVFRGGRDADAKYGRPRSTEGGFRGGRGGRGGFEGSRGGRGGRGGFTPREPRPERSDAPRRGGRGGAAGKPFAPRGGFQKAAVPINDERAFPALGQ